MPILCIKIGQNEPDGYEKLSGLYRHGDIISLIMEKMTTVGREADKDTLVIPFDFPQAISKEDRNKIRLEIERSWIHLNTDVNKTPITRNARLSLDQYSSEQNMKRQWTREQRTLYWFDIDALADMSEASRQTLALAGLKKQRTKNFNLTELGVNDFHRKFSWNKIKSLIKNKHSGKTVIEELGL